MSVVALMFLLEHLPDFSNVPNATIIATSQTDAYPQLNIQACDRAIYEPVLEVIGKKLHIEFVPQWPRNTHHTNELFNNRGIGLPPETTYNLSKDTDVDWYGEEHNIENNNVDKGIDKSECETKKKDDPESDLNNNISFAKRAPFLVAIFETLSNVTAQTCAGTLLSPRWVLTAANCIDLLHVYSNSTNGTEKSFYTVIVGATDPLSDGTVHNVTKILVHPATETSVPNVQLATVTDPTNHVNVGSKSHLLNTRFHTKHPSLALMKLEPAAYSETLRIVKNNVPEQVVVTMYGWMLGKNDYGHDVMHIGSASARTMTSLDCIANNTLIDQRSAICLSVNNETAAIISQMNCGGPVVAVRGGAARVLAVLAPELAASAPELAASASASASARAPLLAHALPAHAPWIHAVITQ